jgi:superfamily II DNA or RNA helicase
MAKKDKKKPIAKKPVAKKPAAKKPAAKKPAAKKPAAKKPAAKKPAAKKPAAKKPAAKKKYSKKMAKKQKNLTYIDQFGKEINNIIKDYQDNIEDPNPKLINDYSVFETLQEGVTNFPLRHYQKDSLYLLDYLFDRSQSELNFQKNHPGHDIDPLVDGLLDEIEDHKKAPYIGYEMATGSGKTMLMGASIYLLNKKYGIKNFLIITPSSTDIYQKTIKNFTKGTPETVWHKKTPFTFNLCTGDNYGQQNLFYDKSNDANIFIFNISKFKETDKGKKDKAGKAVKYKTDQVMENATWTDDKGNRISIKKFLRSKKLVIITDEAHHAQNKASADIIKSFDPKAVLEFTATAVEDASKAQKKNQNIVFKYNIKQFLEDGYGKIIRAVALAATEKEKGKPKELHTNEKLKLITMMLIHMVKKKSVLQDPKCKGLKPLAFVKVKDDTKFSEKVFDYIKNDLAKDISNIKTIIDKVKQQDLEITTLIQDLFIDDFKSDVSKIQKEIENIANNVIFYHGKSDAETNKKWANIKKNDTEIVIYMQKLDEGIDLPNIYTIAVINDVATELRTSIKQIIGRGIRLNKDKREFDDEDDALKANSEKLHIVCDLGKAFEEVIEGVQKDFGLNSKYLGFEKGKRKPIINKIKATLLENLYVPHIKADLKIKSDVNVMDEIRNIDLIISNYIDQNCYLDDGETEKRRIRYRPDGFFTEVDIISDPREYLAQLKKQNSEFKILELNDADAFLILNNILNIRKLPCIPDTERVKDIFKGYINRFNELKLIYPYISESDDFLAKQAFIDSFSNYYYNHIHNLVYRLDFNDITDEKKLFLKDYFKDETLYMPSDQEKNDTLNKVKEKESLVNLIEEQYNFYGFDKSAYDYDKFDSHTEFQMAKYLDYILKTGGATGKVIELKGKGGVIKASEELPMAAEPIGTYGFASNRKGFWVRNQRNVSFSYGLQNYYPDFIFFKDSVLFVIETKGEVFSDSKKNELLRHLDVIPGHGEIKKFKGLIVFSHQMDKMKEDYVGFDKFIAEAESNFFKHQSKSNLLKTIKEEDKFKKYLPAYTPGNAYKKFVEKNPKTTHQGWREVTESNYPNNCFVVQVKGDILEPDYSHNSWIILNTVKDSEEANGNVSLMFKEGIKGSYPDGFALRRLDISKENFDLLFSDINVIGIEYKVNGI